MLHYSIAEIDCRTRPSARAGAGWTAQFEKKLHRRAEPVQHQSYQFGDHFPADVAAEKKQSQ